MPPHIIRFVFCSISQILMNVGGLVSVDKQGVLIHQDLIAVVVRVVSSWMTVDWDAQVYIKQQ